jgi:hypothetical protein
LTASGNLAALLWQRGEYAEAHALQLHLVEARCRRDGADSEKARSARAVLAMMERAAAP